MTGPAMVEVPSGFVGLIAYTGGPGGVIYWLADRGPLPDMGLVERAVMVARLRAVAEQLEIAGES